MNRIFHLLTIALFIGLLLPWIVQDSMFLDGVTYAAISRNMANGLGSFWAPHYTDTLYPQFFEHPPLVFGIESLFFRVLGNGPATERIYTLFTAILTLFLIVSVWRIVPENREGRNHSWLPVLLWILVPVVFWSYRNNMLENTLSVFALAATWFTVKAFLSERFYWLLPAGLFLLAAFLAKGPVGLFPLAIPLLYQLTTRKIGFKKTVWSSAILIIIPGALLFILIVFVPEAGQSLGNYFRQQVLPSLANEREITEISRISLLFKLFAQISLPVLILILFRILSKRSKKPGRTPPNNMGIFFMCVGLSASLPLMLSFKQPDYYLVPSIPFFALGFSFLFQMPERTWNWDLKCHPGIIQATGLFAIVAVAVLTIVLSGRESRDKELLQDIRTIATMVPSDSHISIPDTLSTDWRLIAYLSRGKNISLDSRKLSGHYLTSRSLAITDSVASTFTESDRPLNHYRLFIKRR